MRCGYCAELLIHRTDPTSVVVFSSKALWYTVSTRSRLPAGAITCKGFFLHPLNPKPLTLNRILQSPGCQKNRKKPMVSFRTVLHESYHAQLQLHPEGPCLLGATSRHPRPKPLNLDLYWGLIGDYIGITLGLYGDNGKENGNYYNVAPEPKSSSSRIGILSFPM